VSLFSGANNFTVLIEKYPEFASSLFCLSDTEIRATYGRYIAEPYREQAWLQHSVSAATAAGKSRDAAVVDAVMDRFRVLFDGYRLHPQGALLFNTVSVIASLSEKKFVYWWTRTGPPAQQHVLTSVATDLSAEEIHGLVDGTVRMRWNKLKEPVVVTHKREAIQMAFQQAWRRSMARRCSSATTVTRKTLTWWSARPTPR
jgi:hypothetical protein